MLNIKIIGDEILRRIAQDVTAFDEDLENLAKEMIETMHEADGIGLAAPQIGISKQLLVVDISSIDEKMGPQVFVNPEIVNSEGEITMEEGCLSIPNVREDVTRPETVVVNYQSVKGEEKTDTYSGWMARVLQHEIDHLNGILFTDYLSPVKQKLLLADLQA